MSLLSLYTRGQFIENTYCVMWLTWRIGVCWHMLLESELLCVPTWTTFSVTSWARLVSGELQGVTRNSGPLSSCDTLVISMIDFRHDHCKWKILGKVDCCQNIHHQESWFHLVNHEMLLQSCVRWQIWGAELSYLHKRLFLIKCLV